MILCILTRVPNWHKISPSKVTTTFLEQIFPTDCQSSLLWAVFQRSCQHNHCFLVRQNIGKIKDNSRVIIQECQFTWLSFLGARYYDFKHCDQVSFWSDEKTGGLKEQTSLIWLIILQFKGDNSGVSGAIELVLDIGIDSMSLSIVTKFHKDLIKTIWLREQKHLAACTPTRSFF